MKHLRYDLWSAKQGDHPLEIMKKLGITYQYAVPQSIADCWHFWNCENVPAELPDFLEVKNWNPMDFIGWGLSRKEAESIIARSKQ